MARAASREWLPCDIKKRDQPARRDLAVEACRRCSYFIAPGHGLLSRFPSGCYDDVPELFEPVTREKLAAND